MELNKNSYDSFNARYLSFEDVAATFIKNSQFDDLLSNSHSVVMGPRGCGKTTLLKMLYPQALYSWKNEDAVKVQENIPFWAIYIPTDSQWCSQLKYMQEKLHNSPRIAHGVSNALVCINILIALCNCYRDLINISEGEDTFDKDTELSKELINVWEIERPITPSIYSIIQYFNKEVEKIDTWVKKIYLNPHGINLEDTPKYFYKDFLNQVVLGNNAFQEVFKNNDLLSSKKFKWALCFDELEIAPEWLRKKIFSEYIRSKDQSILFKITSTPLMDWNNIFDNEAAINNIPSKENDYNVIRTWVFDASSGNNWNIFCEKLLRNILQKQIPRTINPKDIFGEYDIMNALEFEESDFKSETNKDYIQDSRSWKLFTRLASKDDSFKEFLLKKGIDPSNPENKEKEDSILRKIKPIAAFRYYFMKNNNELRSRKVANLYFGLPFIYELSEGNPRTAINMINSFVSMINTDRSNILIPINKQSSVINEFSKLRLDYYNNYPSTSVTIKAKEVTMGDFLNQIGNYFKNELFDSTFKPEPVNCFLVDRNTPTEALALVDLSLNLGAIQYIDPEEDVTKDGLYGRKFKLSYILYPSFCLPKRVSKPVALSTIIDSCTPKETAIQGSFNF